jgi:hypothetical protein
MVKESIMERRVQIKKKNQGFPHVFYIEILKTALLGDMKLWSSRRYRHRRRRYRRHRRSRSKVERKSNDSKGEKLVMANKRSTWY